MILARYVIKQTALTTLLVLGFLVVVLLGGRLIRYFGMAAQGGLQLPFLFRLIGYNLPYFLELILPVAFFIALMLTFGRLYADSEMAAINAAGISKERVAWLLLPLLLPLIAIQGYLSLIAKPWGVRQAQTIWQQQSLAQAFDLVRPNEFISSGNYHLYVGELGAERQFVADVVVIEKKPNADTTLILASRASQAEAGTGAILLDLFDGKRYQFNHASLAYHVIGFESYRLSLDTKDMTMPQMKIAGKTTAELLSDKDRQHLAELGYRLSLPFLMVFALLLALPLSKVSPRQGRWLKLVPAILSFVLLALGVIALKEPIGKGKISIWAYPLFVGLCFVLLVFINSHAYWRRLITKSHKGRP